MAEKKEKIPEGQMDLIEVHDEEVKPIIQAARRYKELVKKRMAALEKEVKQKQVVINLIKEANLQKLDGDVIHFKHDGLDIKLTPGNDSIKVTEVD